MLILPAALLAAEDFRTREVSVVWLVLLAVAAITAGRIDDGFRPMLQHTLCNSGILLFFGGLLVIWQLLRRRPVRNFFADYFGGGDVAAMLAVTPVFEPVDYIRFLLAAALAALVGWFVRRPQNIPFVGFLAAALILYALYKIVWN